MDSLDPLGAVGQGVAAEELDRLTGFRGEVYRCLTRRGDELFELLTRLLCAEGPVKSLVGLCLAPEHRRGHGALYDAVNCGRVDADRLRETLAGLPVPRMFGGRIVLAVDVSPWLRPDAATCPERLFCHIYGRGRDADQRIPGWPNQVAGALESGPTSWTAVLDAVRLGPADDATAVIAAQLRAVVGRLRVTGHWRPGDPAIMVMFDSGYDVTRLAYVLADLPVHLVGRIRADRVMLAPAPPRSADPRGGRPRRHGAVMTLADAGSWPTPTTRSVTDTARYGQAEATSWDRMHPRLASRGPWIDHPVGCRSSRARSSGCRWSTCPGSGGPSRSGCGSRPPAATPKRSPAAGRPTCAASIWSTPSGCSSRPWAGPPRRPAPRPPPTAGPGW